LGDKSSHLFIAALACETGIAPSVLMQESERMLFTMQMYLKGKSEAMNKRR
jgi:hypothetical protein